MRYALIIALLIFSATSHAGQKIWSCQEVANAGLKWRGGEYRMSSLDKEHYTIKQMGNKLIFSKETKLGRVSMSCSRNTVIDDVIACEDNFKNFALNTNTGRAIISINTGWLDSANKRNNDNLITSALTCETY